MEVVLYKLVLSFLVLFSQVIRAEQSTEHFQLRMENPYPVNQIQVFKPRISVGPDELIDLEFTQWIPIDEDEYPEDESLTDNIVGLTSDGKLYHTVQLGTDNYARLLSSSRCVAEIQMLRVPQVLMVRDCENNILVYSAKTWIQNPAIRIALHRSSEFLVYGGLSFAFIQYIVQLNGGDLPAEVQLQMRNWLAGFTGFSLFLIQAAKGLFDLEALNYNPDGLLPTGIVAESLSTLTPNQIRESVEVAQPEASDWKIDCETLLKYHMDRELL